MPKPKGDSGFIVWDTAGQYFWWWDGEEYSDYYDGEKWVEWKEDSNTPPSHNP